MTFSVVLGMFTHGASLNFVVFFGVVVASFVVTHYIYSQEKIVRNV